MIVRNEAPIIRRCLQSVLPAIDAYSIVDTGSTDDTMRLIRSTLAELPGALVERPWVDFATNRTQALELAAEHGDVAFMLDADDVVEFTADWSREAFHQQLRTADVFDVPLVLPPIEYSRPQLTSTTLPFRYRGVVHEYLVTPPHSRHGGLVRGFRVRCGTGESNRSVSGNKFRTDVEVLRAALAAEDDEALRCRYTFYLAQSLRDAGDLDAAEQAYRQRATMGGYVEERCVAWMEVGHLVRRRGGPPSEAIDAYLHAYDEVPARAEALCYAAETARLAGRMPTAYTFAERGFNTPRPATGLFVNPSVYDWRLAYEASIAAYYVGEHEAGLAVSRALLAGTSIPPAERRTVLDNLRFYLPADAADPHAE